MQLTILLIIQTVATAAFSINHTRAVVRSIKTALNYHPETFERAVDCASNYGMCDVDELLNLAKGQYSSLYHIRKIVVPYPQNCPKLNINSIWTYQRPRGVSRLFL
jgi:hypothetical protein